MPNRPGRPRNGPGLAQRAAEYKVLRESGLTYAEAAEKMGVSPRAVADYARHLRDHGDIEPISPDITPARQARMEQRQARAEEYATLRAGGVPPGDALARIGLTGGRGNAWRYEYALRHDGQMPPKRETPQQPSRYRVAVLQHLRRWPHSLFSSHDLVRVLAPAVGRPDLTDNRPFRSVLEQLAAQGVVEVVDGVRYPTDRRCPARRYRLAAAPPVLESPEAAGHVRTVPDEPTPHPPVLSHTDGDAR
ncbi:hypothetical protein AB0L65_32835 [Nonomuraea sp. NPDC052116]|uniref:helix-turn-helix domain-containing protein n=1 Tax=Nonomuraea sp. NPDC052116 TaxID=3155665 RepID=UPI003414C7C6